MDYRSKASGQTDSFIVHQRTLGVLLAYQSLTNYRTDAAFNQTKTYYIFFNQHGQIKARPEQISVLSNIKGLKKNIYLKDLI